MSRPPESHRSALDVLLLFFVAVPYALSSRVPGLDVPWHTLFAAAVNRSAEPDYFLGYLAVDFRLTTYASLYALIDWLAVFLDVATAMRVIVCGTAVAWALAGRSLMISLGRDPRCALLIAPLFFSAVHAYGFVAFNLALPAVVFVWSMTLRFVSTQSKPAWVGILLASLFVAITHAVAAVVALAGMAVLLVASRVPLRRRVHAMAAAVGTAPALVALLTMGRDDDSRLPDFIREASLWDRLMAQPFSAPWTSLAELPANAVAYLPGWMAVAFVVLGWVLLSAGSRRPIDDKDGRRAFVSIRWLAAALTLGYLVTPYSFDWPRVMIGAQPRMAPVVVALVTAALAPRVLRRWQVACVALLYLGAVVFVCLAFARFGNAAAEFNAVASKAEPGKLTLALIEQPLAPDRGPAGPLRHFGAYIAVERGGFVSNAPTWAQTQPWVPVRLTKSRPAGPPAGFPRTYRRSKHPQWQQLLIFDGDPRKPFDYARAAGGAEVLARVGHWRLLRVRGAEEIE